MIFVKSLTPSELHFLHWKMERTLFRRAVRTKATQMLLANHMAQYLANPRGQDKGVISIVLGGAGRQVQGQEKGPGMNRCSCTPSRPINLVTAPPGSQIDRPCSLFGTLKVMCGLNEAL